jgi:uncharacterized protein (TIGR02231 family)
MRVVQSMLPVVTLSLISLATSAPAQDGPPAIAAVAVPVDAKITAVTAYRGRAAVTRSAAIELERGLYDLQFTNLPETVQTDTLQARVRTSSGAVQVVGVDFSTEALANAASQQIAALDARIKDLKREIAMVDEQHKINAAHGKFIDDITAKVSAESSKAIGVQPLDLDALRNQINFLQEEREKLANRRLELDEQKAALEGQLRVTEADRNSIAGSGKVGRSAIVAVVCTESAKANVELTYLVANATWQPTYNIRASMDGSVAQIEYDALLTQRTGEDWDNVKLTLSTALPTVAANPPVLQPWFVDIYRPEPVVEEARARRAMPPPAMKAPIDRDIAGFAGEDKSGLERLGYDAQVAGSGPSVTFEIPRAVTVKTNIQKQQRTRIATINATPRFVHVAMPALTDAVYVRGDLANSSAYQLLPGPASIFVAQDYVGPTTLESVAPGGEFKLHFGIDPAVKATRQLVAKRTENTGLLGGGRRTAYDYRLAIDNGTNKAITIELWDRHPVSRNEQIQIEAVDISHPLANDAKYLAEEKPQGLLKWLLTLPANSSGKNALVITYGVRINRAKDVETTPLPE